MELAGKTNLVDDDMIELVARELMMEIVDHIVTNYDPSVEFIVIHNKTKYPISMPLSSTIKQLKEKMFDYIGVSSKVQKVMVRGLARDDQTLESLNINSSSEIMIVGNKIIDIVAAEVVDKGASLIDNKPTKEPLCKKKIHMKVLQHGIPNDAMIGILNFKEPLPPYPLSGMLNKYVQKVRLIFRLEMDQLWISTKEKTLKLPMADIRNIVSEPIEEHIQYYIVGFQLNKTEASYYWVYWVPAQYVDSIKKAIRLDH